MHNIIPDAGVLVTPTTDLYQAVVTHGKCVGSAHPDDWFPAEPSAPPKLDPRRRGAFKRARQRYEETARLLCGGCPVRMECLEYALRAEAGMPLTWIHGIFGGLAPWERARIIRYRRRAAMREVA